jgi:hypothetical protein
MREIGQIQPTIIVTPVAESRTERLVGGKKRRITTEMLLIAGLAVLASSYGLSR